MSDRLAPHSTPSGIDSSPSAIDGSTGIVGESGGQGFGGKVTTNRGRGFQTADWVMKGDTSINPLLLSADGSDLIIIDIEFSRADGKPTAAEPIITKNDDGSVFRQYPDRTVTDIVTSSGTVHREEFTDGRKTSDIQTKSGSIHKEENPDGSSSITYVDDVNHRRKTTDKDKHGTTTDTEESPETYSQVKRDRNGKLIEGTIIDKRTNQGKDFRPGPDGNIIETPVSSA